MITKAEHHPVDITTLEAAKEQLPAVKPTSGAASGSGTSGRGGQKQSPGQMTLPGTTDTGTPGDDPIVCPLCHDTLEHGEYKEVRGAKGVEFRCAPSCRDRKEATDRARAATAAMQSTPQTDIGVVGGRSARRRGVSDRRGESGRGASAGRWDRRRGVVRGVPALTVEGMDLYDSILLPNFGTTPIPPRWAEIPSIETCRTLADVTTQIEQLDDASDDTILALLGQPLDDQLVVPVLLAGVRRVMHQARGRNRERLNDLVTETAIVICELRRARSFTAGRRLGYVIVDRAHDRQRAREERVARAPLSSEIATNTLVSGEPQMDDVVDTRLRLHTLRSQVAASGDPALVRSWNTLVELVGTPRDTAADRYRWKYVRRRLNERLDPDAA